MYSQSRNCGKVKEKGMKCKGSWAKSFLKVRRKIGGGCYL